MFISLLSVRIDMVAEIKMHIPPVTHFAIVFSVKDVAIHPTSKASCVEYRNIGLRLNLNPYFHLYVR